MNCPRCGSQLYENENFCRGCGMSLSINNNQNSYSSPINNFSNAKYKLSLIRKKSFIGCAIAFDIFIDGELVGKIRNGKTLDVEVSAGTHKILVGKKNAIDRSVNDNDLSIEINGDTIAEIAVLGFGNFRITKVSGPSKILDDSATGSKKLNSSAIGALVTSISAPIVFAILMLLNFVTFYIFMLFGLGIGYPLINLLSLKNWDNLDPKFKRALIIKNVLALIIAVVATIVATYIVIDGNYV